MNATINIPMIYHQFNNSDNNNSNSCSNSDNDDVSDNDNDSDSDSDSDSNSCSDNNEIKREPKEQTIAILIDTNTPPFKQELYITTEIKSLPHLHHKHHFYMFDEIRPIFFGKKKIDDGCITIYPNIPQISLFNYFNTLDIDLFTHRFIQHYTHLKKGIKYIESVTNHINKKKEIIPITFIINTDNELPLISLALNLSTNTNTNTNTTHTKKINTYTNTYISLLNNYFINILCSVPHERNSMLDAWKDDISI
jgi:hypothetical protein